MSFFFNNAKKDGATLAVANGGSPPPTPVSVSASTGADDPSDASATAVDLNGSADGAPNGSPFMINEANGKPPGSGSSPGRGQTTKGRPMMQGQGQHQQQQQAATAEEGEAGGDLWSSILKGASTHRATPVKNVLILGDSNSGKSTLLQALRYPVDPLHPQSLPDLITSDDPDRSSVELALSYSYVDVMEDDNSQNDEPAARIGLYELASDPPYPHLQPDDPNMERDLEMHRRAADAAFAPLIRFAITPTSLADSCVVICLDWSKPWTFLRSLERYLGMLQREIMKVVETVGPPGAGAAAAAAASAKAGTAGAGANGQRRGSTFSRFYDLREKLIQFVRDYKEPDPNATASTASNAAGGAPASGVAKGPDLSAAAASYNQHNLTQPLGPGVLCNNVAIPVIVVCSKSDTTGQLEREREFTDDMFDFIQQSLRTLCLKYGAALFFVSSHRPATITSFRSYLLHRLLGRPGSPAFAYRERAQVVDRDSIRVPTGWDSWGMIRVQGSGFDCESMAGFAPGSGARAGQGAGVTCSAPEWGADYTTELARARAIYESVVKNPGAEKMFTMNPAITAEDEQAFLERNLELLSSMSGTAMSGAGSPLGSAAYAENVSSRLATSSMSSTDMLEDVSAKLARLAKLKEQSQVASMVREKSKGSGDITLPAGLVQGANGANGAPGTSQNEVLANFFQSLLTKKAGAGGAAVPGTNTSVASLGSGRSSSVSNAGGSGQRSTSMTLGGGGSSMGLGASSATSSPQGSPQSVNGHLAVPGSPPDRGA